MPHPRALLLLAGLGLGTALVSACDRAVTAPQLGPARAGAVTATELQLVNDAGLIGAAAIVPVAGGRIELAARPGSPVDCTLEVPAGALEGPTFFQLTREARGADLTIRLIARTTELQAEPQLPGEDALALSLTSAAPEGTQEVTVEFSPPDGSEMVVTRVTLRAGRASVLSLRRGRSKYSVIFF